MPNEFHDSLTVKSLSIVDDSGNQKILISTIDANEQPLASDGEENESIPFIQLYDAKGIPRLVLSLSSSGTPIASLFTAESVQTAMITTREEEDIGAGILLWSGNGKYCMELSVTDDGIYERAMTQTGQEKVSGTID